MATVRIVYVDPRADVVRRADVTWVVAGRIGAHLPVLDVDAAGPGDGAVEADLCRRLGDGTVLRVDHPGGRAVRVRAWRGGPASYEVHWAFLPEGDLVVADHFRNAVALVPVSGRQPSEAVTIDHFLFRHARGGETYSASVERAAHGEAVDIDLASGAVHRSVFDRLGGAVMKRPVEQYVADLDRALGGEMAGLRDVPGLVTMLSGGTDSTLLQS